MKNKIIVVTVAIAVIVVAGILSYFLTKGDGELTIVSFDMEDIYYAEMDGENIPILSLYIDDYGVTGNEVWIKGTVNWVGPADRYTSKGAEVSMSIKRCSSSSVNVEVFTWSGLLIWGKETIANDTIDLPQMGGAQTLYVQSFDFRLSANVTLPVPYPAP